MILCDPTECSTPGSSLHEVLQASVLEWVVMPSSRGPSPPGVEPVSLLSPASVGGFLAAHTTCYASLSQRGYTVRSYMLLDRQQHSVSSLTENLDLTLMPRWREKVVS